MNKGAFTNKVCDMCDDGDGYCVFPYQGLAPHKHEEAETGKFLGKTTFYNDYEIPDNFEYVSDGVGVYTHCLHCGAPKNE